MPHNCPDATPSTTFKNMYISNQACLKRYGGQGLLKAFDTLRVPQAYRQEGSQLQQQQVQLQQVQQVQLQQQPVFQVQQPQVFQQVQQFQPQPVFQVSFWNYFFKRVLEEK